MKLVSLLGIIVGLFGSIWLAIIGMHDVSTFGSETSEYHNGLLFVKYGSVFSLIFLVTLWMMNKQYWKMSLLIGFLCTAFSVLGLFSIGPYIFWGSIFILIFSFINVIRLRDDNKESD
ncbi:hypothetical protein GCM10010911_48180 [Paenibacillus nasutitermitis]|uniref:Uncharacterized protein n=1 Tax=Paenibacillus nasutitermitis TaxID=1652958 RepID=A0A917E0F2_9BACL|nr:hypothetical protein GCM10010911_48180 [Paenibacillus nasutitermitis]